MAREEAAVLMRMRKRLVPLGGREVIRGEGREVIRGEGREVIRGEGREVIRGGGRPFNTVAAISR